MKRAVFFLLPLMAGLSWAQQAPSDAPTPNGTIATVINFPVEKVLTPSVADLYCAGFVRKPEPRSNFVTGGTESPFNTNFVEWRSHLSAWQRLRSRPAVHHHSRTAGS